MILKKMNINKTKILKNERKKLFWRYSGGLDTSVILKWLIEKNYEVIAFCCRCGTAG